VIMARVLTKIRIDEVSAVDRAAGENTKIILMKRHAPSLFSRMMAKADAADDGDDDAGTADITNQHPVIAAARLLVASGRFGDHGDALDYLLNKPGGRALLARLKAADQSAKDAPMDSLTAIMKSTGIAATCAAIVQKGTTSFTEAELVEAVGKAAVERHPELSEAQAFSRVYAAGTDESRVLQHALSVAKAAEFAAFDIKPAVVGGEDAQDVTAAVRAYEEIIAIGRKRFPFLSVEQQFARVIDDSNYRALAEQVHTRPSPPSSSVYGMPRSFYAKEADPAPNADSAYTALMVKAAELRKTQPTLTEAQAFSKVFTDPANIELAKRERAEAAPR
jgi:hypothetical protein